jgi:MFS transporter, ACS family, hexuronate transporter
MSDSGRADRSDTRFVALVLAWQVAASSCYYTIFAATPFFRQAFSLSGLATGAIVTVLTLGYTAFLIPVGGVIDGRGERTVLLVALCGLVIATVAVTVVSSYPALLVVLVGLGAAYASAIPGTNKAIMDGVASGRRNFALGIKQVGVTAGSAISALIVTGIGGSWRTGFLVIAAIAVGINAIFYYAYRSRGPNGTTVTRTDGAGEKTSQRSVTPEERGDRDRGDEDNESTLAALGDLFAYRSYRRLTAAGFFLGATLFTTVGYTVLYVSESIGATVAFGGVVLACVQGGGSVGRIGAGWLGDRLPGSEGQATLRVLLAQAALGTVAILVVTQVDSGLTSLVAFGVLGLFVLGFTGIYYSCMGALVPSDRIASATAGGQIALNAGAVFAPPAFGFLVDSTGYEIAWGFLACCGAIATGLLLSIARNLD